MSAQYLKRYAWTFSTLPHLSCSSAFSLYAKAGCMHAVLIPGGSGLHAAVPCERDGSQVGEME